MLFALFGNRVKPRRFSYVPRFYDPEKERDRRDRLQFRESAWQKKRAQMTRGMNPFFLALLAIVMAALIYTLHQETGPIRHMEEVQLTPEDAVPNPGAAEGATP